MTIGTFAYAFSGTTGAVINLRMVPNGYTPAAGEFVILADVLPSPNLAAVRKFTDWYWIVNDTNPTTQVYSTASNAFVSNTAAAFLTWLSANNSPTSPPGSAFPVHGMANNGVGLIRVQLGSTAALQTGQQFNVAGQTGQAAATGNWAITVIDATHIDLQASVFNAGDPWVSGGMVQGASIIDTAANLSVTLNNVAIASWTVSQTSQTSASDIQLTNPLPAFNGCSISAAGHFVILPQMNTPTGVPEGQLFTIFHNAANLIPFDIKTFGGGSAFTTLFPGDSTTLFLADNGTSGGSVKIVSRTQNQAAASPMVHSLRAANNSVTPTTKMDITWDATLAVEQGAASNRIGQMRWAQSQFHTLDITVTGANGFDGNGTLTAGDTVSVYGISNAVDAAAGFAVICTKSTLTLPAGYTHSVYLFSMILVTGPNVPQIYVRGGEVFYQAEQLVLSGGTATTETIVSVATFVPSNADYYTLEGNFGATAIGGGLLALTLSLRIKTGVQFVGPYFQIAGTASTTSIGPVTEELPNVSQQFRYLLNVAVGTSPSATLNVTSYHVPNGA